MIDSKQRNDVMVFFISTIYKSLVCFLAYMGGFILYESNECVKVGDAKV